MSISYDTLYHRSWRAKRRKLGIFEHERRTSDNWSKLTIRHLRHSAKARNLDFNIDESDIPLTDVCPVLGIPLVVGDSTGSIGRSLNPSVDRIDNSKGYIKGNVRVISLRANKLKGDATLEEIEQIHNYMKGSKS